MKKTLVVLSLATIMVQGAFAGTEEAAPAAKANSTLSTKQQKEATGWGYQIGLFFKAATEAIGDGVETTTDQVLKVADSKVGRIATFVIVYKIIGKELLTDIGNSIKVLFGIILMCVYVRLLAKFYQRFFYPMQVLESEDKDGNKTYKQEKSLAEKIDTGPDCAYGISWLAAFASTIIFIGVGILIAQIII